MSNPNPERIPHPGNPQHPRHHFEFERRIVKYVGMALVAFLVGGLLYTLFINLF